MFYGIFYFYETIPFGTKTIFNSHVYWDTLECWYKERKKERKKERSYKTGRKLKDTWPPTPFQEKEKILFSFFKHYFLFVFDDMEGFEMEPCVTDLGNYQFYKKDWINFVKTSLKSHPLMVTLSSTLKINNLKNCVNWTIDRVYKKNC